MTARIFAKTSLKLVWLLFFFVSYFPTFAVAEGPKITTSESVLPHGVIGVQYNNFTFEQEGGKPPLKWKSGASQLPAGLSLDESNGTIFGRPTTATDTKVIEITVEDSESKKDQRDFYITVFADKEKRKAALDNDCFIEAGGAYPMGDLGAHVSVGPAVTTQLIRYNFATEKASINAQGLGIGAAFRFYNSNDMEAAPGSSVKDIRRIHPKCRANTISTFESDGSQYRASSWLSVTPTIFASVAEAQGSSTSEVSVQPALMVGFLRDLINIGVGWNLAGPNRGQVFLLMGIGAGFRF